MRKNKSSIIKRQDKEIFVIKWEHGRPMSRPTRNGGIYENKGSSRFVFLGTFQPPGGYRRQRVVVSVHDTTHNYPKPTQGGI